MARRTLGSSCSPAACETGQGEHGRSSVQHSGQLRTRPLDEAIAKYADEFESAQPTLADIGIQYRQEEGFHIFMAEAFPGLYVAHRDRAVACGVVLSSLAKLAALDAAPLPESTQQDAALYRELLYAVSKKWPGESRHETALRYIRRAEEEGSKELGATIRTQGTEG
jgi:hypothetical protein